MEAWSHGEGLLHNVEGHGAVADSGAVAGRCHGGDGVRGATLEQPGLEEHGGQVSRSLPGGLSYRGQVLQGLLTGWGEQGSMLARAPSRLGTGIGSCKGSGWGQGASAPSGESWGLWHSGWCLVVCRGLRCGRGGG